MQISTLRPGLLVSLSTSVRGNVNYQTRDLEREHRTEDGEARARWETLRITQDPEEHAEAIKTRSKARSLITAVCSHSSFGLLCPETESSKLDAAILEAQQLAARFNNEARLTRVAVYAIVGRIAQDDVQAVRAINAEVRGLLDDMQDGLRNLDIGVVRDAANKARSIGAMLSPDAQTRIKGAIDAARSAARKIAKAGEEGAVEIDTATLRNITAARTAFLDLEEGAEIQLPEAAAHSIDLEPEDEDDKDAKLSPEAMGLAPVARPMFELD